MEGAAATQNVREQLILTDRRNPLGRNVSMYGKTISEAVQAHRTTLCVEE